MLLPSGLALPLLEASAVGAPPLTALPELRAWRRSRTNRRAMAGKQVLVSAGAAGGGKCWLGGRTDRPPLSL